MSDEKTAEQLLRELDQYLSRSPAEAIHAGSIYHQQIKQATAVDHRACTRGKCDGFNAAAARIADLEKAQSLFNDSEFFKVCERVVDLERLRDCMKSEIERLATPPPASQWQPIETAPKGRKLIVGYKNRLGKWRTVTACYYLPGTLMASDDDDNADSNGYAEEGWYEESESHEFILRTDEPPTHWMPLPAAPSDETPTPLTEADIVPGREFIWMPNMPGARCRVRVVEIQRHPNGDVDVAAMLLENSAVSRKDDVCRNDMSRFLEACVRAPESEGERHAE